MSYMENVAALPPPIQDSVNMLKSHIYQSCADVEECVETVASQYPFLTRQSIVNQRVTNTERFYRILLPILQRVRKYWFHAQNSGIKK